MCHQCKVFQNETKLYQHVQSHDSITLFCSHCNKMFRFCKLLYSHNIKFAKKRRRIKVLDTNGCYGFWWDQILVGCGGFDEVLNGLSEILTDPKSGKEEQNRMAKRSCGVGLGATWGGNDGSSSKGHPQFLTNGIPVSSAANHLRSDHTWGDMKRFIEAHWSCMCQQCYNCVK